MYKLRPFSLPLSLVLMAGCQIISPPADGDDFIECVDPLELVDGTDYVCGDEVIVVVVVGADGEELFLDVFTIEAQDENANRFLLINELDVDICGDITVTIGGAPHAFEVGCLFPGEIFFVNSECAETFLWGDHVDGLCLFEPL